MKNHLNKVLMNEKKHFKAEPLLRKEIHKAIIIMRFTILLLFMCIGGAIASSSYSQTARLTFEINEGTISEVIKAIEDKSAFTFVYNVRDLNLNKKVSVKFKNNSIDDILKKIFDDNSLAYVITDHHITLYKRSLSSLPQQGNTRKITGKITDGQDNPVIGANIIQKGTTNGTISNLDGNFELSVPDGSIVTVTYIGYLPQEIRVAALTDYYPVVLLEDSKTLDEVVVTALGIKREKKALGYAMQEIKTEAFSEIRSESIANMLQGKVAGVQINQTASDVGGSTRVVLRGTTSLGSSPPLWIVDGVPIDDGQIMAVGGYSGGRDAAGGASEFNPENVESISVLKGANAAALYGSRAQNGAIIITTKQGKAGKLTVEYNGNLTLSQTYNAYDLQDVYGQGSNGEYSASALGSWGGRMDGTIIRNWREQLYGDSRYESYPYSPQGDYVSKFYDTGVNYTNSVTVSGGTESFASRFSFSDSRNKGVTPHHELNRQYYDLNTNFNSKYLDVSVSANYIRQTGRQRPQMGDQGVMKALIEIPNNIRLRDLEDPLDADGHFLNWAGPASNYINPYAIILPSNSQRDDSNRLIGRVTAVGKLTDYLKITGRVGLDWRHVQQKEYVLHGKSNTDTKYSLSQSTSKQFNGELSLNFDKQFNDFSVLANFGAAVYKPTSNSLSASSSDLNIKDWPVLKNGQNLSAGEGYSTKRVNSLFGNIAVGYKSMVYLEFTGRNDWSSTLPPENWSYFYPSVSLSGILSEMFSLPEPVSYLKVRGSWAQVGNDTGPYQLHNEYSISYSSSGYGYSASPSRNHPISDLKPEQTTSVEGGLEASFFNNRFGLDVTYYDATTKNQIFTVDVAASSGYRRRLINAGKLTSHGWEVVLRGTPIETKDWTWDVAVNWGRNYSECVELVEGTNYYNLEDTRSAKIRVIPGHRYGEIVGEAYKRNEQGKILVGDNGMPVRESEQIVGNMNPDWIGSFSTFLRWKNLSLNALIDVRAGGDFISYTDMYARTAGTSAGTLKNRESGMVVDGVLESTGERNTQVVSVQDYYSVVGGLYGVAEEFLHDATYIKMRELSIGYTLPKAWLKNLPISHVKLSAVGRNLFYFYKKAEVNPEGSYSVSDGAQAVEYASLPPIRTFGFTLNVKF